MPTRDWLNRDAAFRLAEHSAGRAVFAMVHKQERGMTMAQQIEAALAR